MKEVVEHFGVEWERTEVKDEEVLPGEDPYYYRPLECFCFQSESGDSDDYVYIDEYGDCDYCAGNIVQIFAKGHTIEDPRSIYGTNVKEICIV
jgi:hypothetical protein